jgi:hypothetical protein
LFSTPTATLDSGESLGKLHPLLLIGEIHLRYKTGINLP